MRINRSNKLPIQRFNLKAVFVVLTLPFCFRLCPHLRVFQRVGEPYLIRQAAWIAVSPIPMVMQLPIGKFKAAQTDQVAFKKADRHYPSGCALKSIIESAGSS